MAAKLKVKSVTILDDTLVKPINQLTDVLGMSVGQLNARIELAGTPADPADVPAQVNIEVMSWEPQRRLPGRSSMNGPLSGAAIRQGSSLVYQASITLSALAPFQKAGDNLKEVATVRRDGGTSDGLFLKQLPNWARRGSSVQSAAGGGLTTGNARAEQPDALTLFRAGGVEVLEVKVPPQAGLEVGPTAKAWVFVRSPADLFFYTGHGYWADGNLLLARDRQRAVDDMELSGHWYRDWLSPEDLLTAWKKGPDIQRSPMDLDILVINGCGVLYTDFKTSPSCAARWAELLVSRQGPLFVILGYRATAPLDNLGGNERAEQLAKAVAGKLDTDWESYPRAWLEINAREEKTYTAAALNRDGYWYINVKTVRHSDGTPWDMPGYDSSIKKGTIIGPVSIF